MRATSTPGGNLLEQAAAERGLARPHLAGELDEPAALADAIEQMGQRLAMSIAHVEVPRVRRDGEGPLGQLEVRGVHLMASAILLYSLP